MISISQGEAQRRPWKEVHLFYITVLTHSISIQFLFTVKGKHVIKKTLHIIHSDNNNINHKSETFENFVVYIKLTD